MKRKRVTLPLSFKAKPLSHTKHRASCPRPEDLMQQTNQILTTHRLGKVKCGRTSTACPLLTTPQSRRKFNCLPIIKHREKQGKHLSQRNFFALPDSVTSSHFLVTRPIDGFVSLFERSYFPRPLMVPCRDTFDFQLRELGLVVHPPPRASHGKGEID